MVFLEEIYSYSYLYLQRMHSSFKSEARLNDLDNEFEEHNPGPQN